MKLNTNVLLQILGVALQVINVAGGLIPSKWQLPVAASVGGAQAVVSAIAHHANPDGTPATVAFVPQEKR